MVARMTARQSYKLLELHACVVPSPCRGMSTQKCVFIIKTLIIYIKLSLTLCGGERKFGTSTLWGAWWSVLLTKYYSDDQIEKNEMGGKCNTYGGEERCIQGLVGKPKRKGTLGRPRHRWEDNIRMDLKEVGWSGGMDWIDLAEDRDRWWILVSAVMNLRVPQNAGNFLTSWGSVSFSRRTLLHGVSK